MTFEDAYGRWLVSEINKQTFAAFGLTCKQYNEVSFKPLAKNPDEIALIISGGGAACSKVSGQDQNSGTFSVMAICQKKYMEHVRAAIATVQKTYNAKVMELSYYDEKEPEQGKEPDPITVSSKSVFFTPLVLDAQDLPTHMHGTLKVVFIQFSVTVLYGETAVVAPEEYSLIIVDEEGNKKTYEVQYVYSFDKASIPTYDTYLAQGEAVTKQIAVTKNNSWAITIYKTKSGNELQTILDNEVNMKDGGLWGKSIALKKGDDTIPIQAYQLTESYVDNAAAYVLTLIA